MQYKCKVTVIDKKCFGDLQKEYLADPASGPCPFYNVGDEFIFERYGGEDTFWRAGSGSQCAEAWDAISRYIYTALQGGAIMRGWTSDERLMIACCNDGTRPVIFKIERIDYKAVRIGGMTSPADADEVARALSAVPGVKSAAAFHERGFAEVYPEDGAEVTDAALMGAVAALGRYSALGVD